MESNKDFDELLFAYELACQILNGDAEIFAKSAAWRQLELLQLHLFNENESAQIDFMNLHCLRRKTVFNDKEFMKNSIKNVECTLDQLNLKTNLTMSTNWNLPNVKELNISCNDKQFTKNVSETANVLPRNSTGADRRQQGKYPHNSYLINKSQNLQLGVESNNAFISARKLLINNQKPTFWSNATVKTSNNMHCNNSNCKPLFNFAATKRSLGMARQVLKSNDFTRTSAGKSNNFAKSNPDPHHNFEDNTGNSLALEHPDLRNIDPKCVEMILQEIIQEFKPVDWSEIAGLDYAKSIIKEAVVYPLLRPDIFTGLRSPPRGILLFGPPGTGKTLIGKCIASQSKSTFFNISSSCLTSKWMGESEKMVRALFAVAAKHQPSVIFIDEVDSLLSQRAELEDDATRRLKTEFLVRLDGAATSADERVLVVGATNRPQELDDAVRRRFTKRLYVSLPPQDARLEILTNLLKKVSNNLNKEELRQIAEKANGFSGADMDSLCREASMEPLRAIPSEQIITFNIENIRPINVNDFHAAFKKIRPSVSLEALQHYEDWNNRYGCSC